MNKEQSIKALQISAILFKYNIPIAEAKFIGSFIEELIQENKKQKEVIDKAIDEIETGYFIDGNEEYSYLETWFGVETLLNILKEVE